ELILKRKKVERKKVKKRKVERKKVKKRKNVEIAKPTVDKNENEIIVADYELIRISLGDATLEGDVHNLRETLSRQLDFGIENIEKEAKLWADLIQDARIMTMTNEKIPVSENIFDNSK
ncbi:hypothetical protein KI387_031620, partial [Taxus chinensis]